MVEDGTVPSSHQCGGSCARARCAARRGSTWCTAENLPPPSKQQQARFVCGRSTVATWQFEPTALTCVFALTAFCPRPALTARAAVLAACFSFCPGL